MAVDEMYDKKPRKCDIVRIFACLCSLSNSGRVFACFDTVDSSQSNGGRIFVCLCSLSDSGHIFP